MRRVAVGLAVVGLIGLSACGSSGSTKTATGSSSATTVTSAVTATTVAAKGATTFADVCSARAAAQPPAQGQTIDFDKAAKDLQSAVDHAPADIKPDLATLLTPLLQYYKILSTAKGSFAQAAQDPQFLALTQKFSQADYQAAALRVQAWFAAHCS